MTGSQRLLKPATVLNMHGLMERVCVGVQHEVKKKCFPPFVLVGIFVFVVNAQRCSSLLLAAGKFTLECLRPILALSFQWMRKYFEMLVSHTLPVLLLRTFR